MTSIQRRRVKLSLEIGAHDLQRNWDVPCFHFFLWFILSVPPPPASTSCPLLENGHQYLLQSLFLGKKLLVSYHPRKKPATRLSTHVHLEKVSAGHLCLLQLVRCSQTAGHHFVMSFSSETPPALQSYGMSCW